MSSYLSRCRKKPFKKSSTNQLIIGKRRTGSYPTVSAHSGDWSLNASTHSLDWSIPIISADEKSGTLEFSVGGDDADTFFPVKVNFIAQGSLIDMGVSSVVQASDGSDVEFSQDVTISADDYSVV